MKTALIVLLAISLTSNAFLIFLLCQKPSRHITPVVQTQSEISKDDYDALNTKYQNDETKIAALKQRLPIFIVMIQAAMDEQKYRGMAIVNAYYRIDTSKCLMDFQQVWLAYVQEKKENQRMINAKIIHFFGDMAAVAMTSGVTLAAVGADAIKTSASGPSPSNLAENNLQQVMLKYGFKPQS
jgi:hypothetical protein